MTLITPPPYLPFADPRMSRMPGLAPLDPAEWFLVQEDFAGQMAERAALLATRRKAVMAVTQAGEAPAAELLEAMLDTLKGMAGYDVGAGEVTRPDGGVVPIDRADPMDTAARLVADDLCVLMPGEAEYLLVAGALCFPSGWRLGDKIGRPMTAIHDPVPDYDADLGRRVNRVFEALRPGRPLWRVNWTVHNSPQLFLLPETDISEDLRRGRFYLRTERQTLTRLPGTGAVVFGIKTSVSPVEALAPQDAAALRAALARMDADTIVYKRGPAAHAAALARLAELSCQPAGQTAS